MEKIKLSFRELWRDFTRNNYNIHTLYADDKNINDLVINSTDMSQEEKDMMLKEFAKAEQNITKLEAGLSLNKKETKKVSKKFKEENSQIPVTTLSNEQLKNIAIKKAEDIDKDMGISR